MGRTRVCCIISARPDGTMRSFLSKEQLEEHKRRANFERQYKKKKIALSCIKNITPELSKYSDGVLKAISEFKSKRGVAV